MALCVRRSAPIWPENGPQRPERRHTAVGAEVGRGKPTRPPWAATQRDCRGVSAGQDGTPALVRLRGGHSGPNFLDRFADFGAVVRLGRVNELTQRVEQGA